MSCQTESAFREGYRAGYESGQADCAAFANGHSNLNKVTEDEAWNDSDAAEIEKVKQ